jgi:hypothetical protein
LSDSVTAGFSRTLGFFEKNFKKNEKDFLKELWGTKARAILT